MKTPPCFRANAHGNSAERMFPRWMKPVGLGAKRVRTGFMDIAIEAKGAILEPISNSVEI
jgi:hypothetical protein